MKAYETIGEVNEQHELRAQLPLDVPVGAARVLVLVPPSETATEEKTESQSGDDWDELMRCIEENQMDTGTEDLAHEHDHYLHGTPKKGRS